MIGNRQIKQLYNFPKLFWILTLSGCVTSGYRADNFDYSLKDIQAVLNEVMPEEVATVSSNGREHFTKPFKQKIENTRPLTLIAKATILGDRRPYDLTIEIHTIDPKVMDPEQAFNRGEIYFGETSLSKRIVTEVQNELAKRRKQKNLFDDFRAF